MVIYPPPPPNSLTRVPGLKLLGGHYVSNGGRETARTTRAVGCWETQLGRHGRRRMQWQADLTDPTDLTDLTAAFVLPHSVRHFDAAPLRLYMPSWA